MTDVKEWIAAEKILKVPRVMPPRGGMVSDVSMGVEIEWENGPEGMGGHGDAAIMLRNGDVLRLQHGILAHADGSLRNNGIELVTPPLRGEAIEEAVHYMCTLALKHDWRESNRAGIHVHVDVQQLSIDQLLDVLCTYTLVEHALFSWAAEKREDSIFCKAWGDDGMTNDLSMWIRAVETIADYGGFPAMNTRYSGLNLSSVRKYGTVEFRHLRTTRDPHRILDWCNMVQKVRMYALDNPNIRKQLSRLEADAVLVDVFGLHGRTLMTPEFHSYFHHRALPMANELFVPRKASVSWERTTKAKTPHPGFTRFMKNRVAPPSDEVAQLEPRLVRFFDAPAPEPVPPDELGPERVRGFPPGNLGVMRDEFAPFNPEVWRQQADGINEAWGQIMERARLREAAAMQPDPQVRVFRNQDGLVVDIPVAAEDLAAQARAAVAREQDRPEQRRLRRRGLRPARRQD